MTIKKTLSGSMLKMIAVISMTIDHIAYFLLLHEPALREGLFSIGNAEVTVYFLLRCVGRLAFPIFAFLIVEGFLHTRNQQRYGRDLLILAIISEIPWILLHDGTLYLRGHNVMFTLLLGYCALCAIDRLSEQIWRQAGAVAVLFAVSIIFAPEYTIYGLAFILMLYITRKMPVIQAAIGSTMLTSTWIAGLAFIPINMYNGERGFIKGTIAKYCFYAFYPLHLMMIYLMR